MFQEQIAKGVEYLDQNAGQSWPARIDLMELHLNSACNCVIGQIYGDFYQRFDIEEGAPFGFSTIDFDQYDQLTREWHEKIYQLREERGL